MRRTVVPALVAAVFALVLTFTAATTCAGPGCGPRPPKPPVPPGCTDLVAQCVCDSGGDRCAWTWACVPR